MSLLNRTLVVSMNPVPSCSNENPDDIRIIKITKERDVPGCYNPAKTHKGYYGLDSKGNEYFNHWENFDESGSSPREHFYCKQVDGKVELLWDITRVLCHFKPNFTTATMTEEDRKEIWHIINWCPEHYRFHYKDEKCFYCEHGIPLKNKDMIKDTTWNGWR